MIHDINILRLLFLFKILKIIVRKNYVSFELDFSDCLEEEIFQKNERETVLSRTF